MYHDIYYELFFADDAMRRTSSLLHKFRIGSAYAICHFRNVTKFNAESLEKEKKGFSNL